MNADSAGLADRIRLCADSVGGGSELSRRTGIPRRTLENYLTGREPQTSRIAQIAEAAGVSLDWLITGKGDMRISPSSVPITPISVDGELLGRINDVIMRTYKEMGVALAAIDLGRLAATHYARIAAASDDADERLVMVKMIRGDVRAAIQSAAAEPGKGKASA